MKQLVGVLLISSLLVSESVEAQLRIGISGGPQRSIVSSNTSPGWDTVDYTYSYRQGFRAGIIADIRLGARSPLYLQSGMYYSTKGRDFQAGFENASSDISRIKAVQHVNYLEIPLQLVLKIKMGKKSSFLLGGGGYAGFLYSGKERRDITYQTGTITTIENKDLKVTTAPGSYNNMEYGWNGTAGFQFGRVLLTGHYGQGMKDFYSTGTSTEGTFRHTTMGANMSILLGKTPENKSKEIKKSKKQSRREERMAKRAGRLDLDGDGIPNELDGCPTLAGPKETGGCPDADQDGVIDPLDVCPTEKGIEKYAGHPIPDSDGDGINNEEDKCPDVKGLAKYNGCPIPDTDGDGLNDEKDLDPLVAGSPLYGGLPIPDTDGDGVNDLKDRCPLTKGVAENRGCAPVKKSIIKKVDAAAQKIQFGYKSVLLTEDSKLVLNEMVALLKANPELKLTIEGHTSADGNPANHQKLSEARANSVRVYLISKGIDPFRLESIGYGASKPIVDAFTAAALAKNRRVEMRVRNN